MCNNYEAQLQGVQEEAKEEQVKAKSLERQLNAEKQISENQNKYISELEGSLKTSAEEAEKQVGMSEYSQSVGEFIYSSVRTVVYYYFSAMVWSVWSNLIY